MLFRKAFELMKQGMKVKLPSWAGYWYWSKEKQTIIMHTKDGIDMDIRETQIPDYTFSNIASDEWTLADSKNCPELGGEATFSFGEAIKDAKSRIHVLLSMAFRLSKTTQQSRKEVILLSPIHGLNGICPV